MVLVLRPRRKSIEVHRASGNITLLSVSGDLSGEDVLPGFKVAVAEIFV